MISPRTCVYLTVCWLTSDLDMSNIGSYYTRSMSQLCGGFTSDQRYEIFWDRLLRVILIFKASRRSSVVLMDELIIPAPYWPVFSGSHLGINLWLVTIKLRWFNCIFSYEGLDIFFVFYSFLLEWVILEEILERLRIFLSFGAWYSYSQCWFARIWCFLQYFQSWSQHHCVSKIYIWSWDTW